MMSNDVLVKMVEQYQTFLESAIKANELSVSSVETLVNFQMNASVSRLDSYISLAKAAANISDIASYQEFLSRQVETSLSLQKKFSDDAKTLAEMMSNFKAEFDKAIK